MSANTTQTLRQSTWAHFDRQAAVFTHVQGLFLYS